MDDILYKVYIQLDERSCITRCDGGITIGNILDFDDWIQIDEGKGDRYGLCQSHYFIPSLYTYDYICRWKYINKVCIQRSEEEIEEERQSRPQSEEADVSDYEFSLFSLGMKIDNN